LLQLQVSTIIKFANCGVIMNKAAVARHFTILFILVGWVSPEADAQSWSNREETKRSLFGISAVLARPVGEFQNFVDWGGGIDLYGVVNLSRRGPLGIRFDGSFLIYGHESLKRPLSNTIQRVTVDVDTDNLIASLGVGPQLTLGHGALRPYLYGTAGFSYFATVSSARGTADAVSFASSTNFDDVTAALTAGGGFLVRLSRGRHPISLDLSAQSVYHGETDYLREGSILESADGSITLVPIRSEANLVTFRLGVAIGV
jgi:hypothetical protein